MSADVAMFAAPPRPASQVNGSCPIRLPRPHRFPNGRHREAGQTQGEPDRIGPKYGSRGEGQPAEPHEGEEFNKQHPNSKARTPTDERSEPQCEEQRRRPTTPPPKKPPPRTRVPEEQRRAHAHPDQQPVPPLQPAKARRRSHDDRSFARAG